MGKFSGDHCSSPAGSCDRLFGFSIDVTSGSFTRPFKVRLKSNPTTEPRFPPDT